jgi:hypothetical protein
MSYALRRSSRPVCNARNPEPNKEIANLENKSSTLGLLVTTQLEVLATLQSELLLGLAGSALKTQDDLLGGLGLLVEDRLGLTTVTTLLPVVTTLTLGEQGGLASLVLGDLVLGVLVALLGLAVRPAGFGNVDLERKSYQQLSVTIQQILGAAVSMSRSSENPIKFGTGYDRKRYRFPAETRSQVLLAREYSSLFFVFGAPSLSLSGRPLRPHRVEEYPIFSPLNSDAWK